MKETFRELKQFLQHPTLEKDTNTASVYRLKKFLHLLIICLITGIVISPIYVIIESLQWVDMQDHAIEEMMEQYSTEMIFFFTVVLAPLIEEAIFRAPLTAFKTNKSFQVGFYVFAVLFGFIHIFNFEITPTVLLLSPVLVLPQLLLGGYLGFIRVRFGLLWSIALHATYNGVVLSLSLLSS